MKNVIRILGIVLTVAGFAVTLAAQTGKPVTIVDANTVSAAELAKLPNMTPDLAKSVIAKRPFKSIKDLDNALSGLTKEQRAELYGKLFVPINLNTATDEEILSIPAAQPNRVLREFKEYRPYTSMDQFHREMRKYWDEKEVNRLKRYVTLN